MWRVRFKYNLLYLYNVCVQGKKDVCQIFNNILRRQIGTRSPTVEYFCSHQEVLFILLKGWDDTSLTSSPPLDFVIYGDMNLKNKTKKKHTTFKTCSMN